MHFAELGTMALVKNQHNMLLEGFMPLVLFDKKPQLLNGGDDDPGSGILLHGL